MSEYGVDLSSNASSLKFPGLMESGLCHEIPESGFFPEELERDPCPQKRSSSLL